jgi:Tfp pilus assembly protein PilP
MNLRLLLSVAFITVVGLARTGVCQDEADTPSKKTKEALEKFKQAPAAVAKSLETAAEAVRRTTGSGAGSGQKTPPEVDLLSVPEKKPDRAEAPRYSSAGKRDPFQPLALRTQVKRRPRENLSPLERYDLGQLKIVGIVWNAKEPRAMVEDSTGLGYVVGIGTPIGPDEGKIREIKPNEVVIEETYIDFYGARKNRRVSMKLASE